MFDLKNWEKVVSFTELGKIGGETSLGRKKISGLPWWRSG